MHVYNFTSVIFRMETCKQHFNEHTSWTNWIRLEGYQLVYMVSGPVCVYCNITDLYFNEIECYVT